MKLIDLTGRRFGRLTVLRRVPPKNKRTLWLCVCDCGGTTITDSYNLRAGHTMSCGCVQRERTSKANKTHGESHRTRLYTIWNSMKNRCYQKSYHAYKHYGGRGIHVCSEWLNSYTAFRDWSLTHGYADDLTIDRIDIDGDYCPENCRWATMAEQNQNKRAPNGYKIEGGNTNGKQHHSESSR